MSVLKKLAGQTVIYGSSIILARLINLAFTPLYTKLFPTDVYHIYTNLYAYVAFINVILTFGMETTFFRFLEDKVNPRKIYNQAFFWLLVMTSLFAVLVTTFHMPIASWMEYEGKEELILMLVAIISLDALAALPLAKLRQEERIKWFSAITIINVLVSLIGNLVFVVWLKWGIEYVFVSNIIASVIRLVLASWKNLPNDLKPDWKVLKGMLDYGFFIMIAGFAYIMNETLDRIMIPFRWEDGNLFQGIPLTGEEMNGIYGANYKVAMLIALATQAFRYAAEPFFFKEAGAKDSPVTFAKVFHYFTLAALGGFLVIGSFTKEIVSFDFTLGLSDSPWTFLNENYWSGIDAVPVLLLAYVFSAAYINLSIWYKITKQTRFAILFTGAGALITVCINYFGIPVYGYMASAWATLICYLVMCILVYIAGQRYYKIPYRIVYSIGYILLFLGAYLLNRSIGPTAGFFIPFLMKSVVCLAAFALIWVAEKFYPPFSK